MSIHPQSEKPGSPGLIHDIVVRAKLVFRLMADRRVSTFVKAIPVLSIAYLVIPDLVIGPLDDAAVVGIAATVFVELCPAAVVAEHMQALTGKASPAQTPPANPEDVVEGKFVDVSSDRSKDIDKEE